MFQRLKSDMKLVAHLIAASAIGVISFGAVAVAAQDTSSDTVRPANIHVGSCDNLGNVVTELKPLVVIFDDNDDDDDNGGTSGSGTGGATTPPADTGTNNDGSRGDDDDDNGVYDDDDGNYDDDDGNYDDDDGIYDNDDDDGFDDDDNGFGSTGLIASTNALQSGGGGFVGAENASIVEGSEDSDVGTNLDALLAEPHAIAVYESEGSDTVIACGTIGGYLRDDDDDDDDDNELAIGLREQNDSGFAGVALLDDDDDDDDLDVDVYIGRDVA